MSFYWQVCIKEPDGDGFAYPGVSGGSVFKAEAYRQLLVCKKHIVSMRPEEKLVLVPKLDGSASGSSAIIISSAIDRDWRMTTLFHTMAGHERALTQDEHISNELAAMLEQWLDIPAACWLALNGQYQRRTRRKVEWESAVCDPDEDDYSCRAAAWEMSLLGSKLAEPYGVKPAEGPASYEVPMPDTGD